MKLKDIYLRIKETAQEKMPYLCYIDLQKKQFERATEDYPVPAPTLLVEFDGADFSNLARHRQMGASSVSIYFYQNIVTDTFDSAELEVETLELLEAKDEIFQTFEGLTITDCSQLVRKSETPFIFESNLVFFKVTFDFVMYEKKIEKAGTIKANPKVFVEFNNK